MMNKQIKIAIIIAIILVLGFGGYVVYKKYRLPISENKNNDLTIQNILPESNKQETDGGYSAKGEPAVGWRLYKSADFGFEIQYPNTWAISEENIENVRGENTKAFYFSPMGGSASGGKKSESDLRFAILPRDGLSYGLPENGASSEVFIGGSLGSQTKWTLSDGRRLWLLYPQYGLYGWSEDIGRIDIQTSATDPAGDTVIFEKMLNSLKLSK